MITTKQYDEALVRLMELNNMYIVPGDKEDLEQQHLLDLRAQYEAEHDEECMQHQGWPGDGSGMDDFEDYNQNEGNDW